MTWGRGTDVPGATKQLNMFLDAGGTLVEASSAYGDWNAQLILGDLLRGGAPREEIVLAVTGGPDASRRGLLADLDGSLERLGTDHVDLFLVGCPDPGTPLTETVGALRHAVTSGRTRYVGLSNHPGWALARVASLLQAQPGDVGLTAQGVEYSLLQRGAEREVQPAALALGAGLLAWSPQGRGVLTGKYRHTIPTDSRAASSQFARFVDPYLTGASLRVVEAVATASSGLGRACGEVALAWLLARPGLAAAVVGARTPAQLKQSLAAAELVLPAEVHAALDDVSAIEIGYPERW